MPDTSLNSHSVIIQGRSRLSLTGVTDVINYDDREIVAATTQGRIKLGGHEFKIERLSIDEGELVIVGSIDTLAYSQGSASRGSALKKLFT